MRSVRISQQLKVDSPHCYRIQLRIKMEIDRESDIVESNSLEEIESCSSSILDTPNREDMYVDDDDYDDGINVTILSSSATLEFNKKAVENSMVEKKLNASATSNSNGNTENNSGNKTPFTGANPKDKKHKRLNGAAKKRFKYLVDHGHSRDEARLLAEKPFRVLESDPHKRRRNADLSESNSSETNPPKRLARQLDRGQTLQVRSSVQNRLEQARKGEGSSVRKEAAGNSGPHKPLYSEVANYIRIGILPEGFPNIELSTQQLTATQNEILKKVAEQRKEPIKPKFGSRVFRPGHMIVTCKNQDTANWLKETISQIQPWENACLIAVDEKDIPRPEILVGFFPLSEQDSNEEIFALVESQNEGLLVDSWRVLKRYTVKQHHVELMFTVDNVSMKSLESNKFIIDYKFGVAYIRHRNTNTESTEGSHNEITRGEKTASDSVGYTREDPQFSGAVEDAQMADPTQKDEADGLELEKTIIMENGCEGSSKTHKDKSDKNLNRSINPLPGSSKGGNNSLPYRQIRGQILPDRPKQSTKAEQSACKTLETNKHE